MNNEWKHATREQSQKLVELGFVLDTEEVWYRRLHGWRIGFNSGNLDLIDFIPAPDVAELGKALPCCVEVNGIKYYLVCENTGDYWNVTYYNDDHGTLILLSRNGETEAQARCAALIWLIENDYIKAVRVGEEKTKSTEWPTFENSDPVQDKKDLDKEFL